ncbi:MAG: Carboxyl-terminal protease [Candidatus Jorgensenbacteria bacterium GW2011_GWA1_48_11]|uniref:Carboxyl-terminal protease n=1 Tax=Candidatus Jorgensenbacteria bacterium GW2011_GWA1_48_11 TaxID=1618660 RepID=A0A0G1UBE4_9BACT|nr:MAG: Carboxyl-terminal protease [Candidatus Jorgensenbacteria bacterium GW2011_GWA1_48_11]KKW11931.1 MAG: Carboxyl-terminal protease [Candidatus Jorgensenbacteria bacterium GW2011_GWB1_49_9]
MPKIIKGKRIKIAALTLLAVVLAGGIFYGGFIFGKTKSVAVSVNATGNTPLSVDSSLLWDAVSLVKSKYVDIKDVSDQDLLYGAIKGVLGALSDPYSVFFPPSDAAKFNQDLSGSFGGIGAELGIRNNQLVVIAPLKNNPAEAAGLKAGDEILSINGTSTLDMDINSAVKTIRGEPGTAVTLTIMRDGWAEAKDFKIVRAIVQVPTLDWEMKPGQIAVFHLYNFNANVPQLFYEGALSALLKGAKGVVLDLRNNPGGFLEVGDDVAGWFLKRGSLIVREQFSPGNYQDNLADGNAALAGIPVVLLVNGGSASASEIVTGALRDNRGVKIVGEKTFGKGSVQEVNDLPGGSSVKISIAKWLTPKGDEINKVGISPDYEVKLTDDDVENGRDPQLDKAIEVLKAEMAK